MHKNKIIITLGVVIALLPLLGFPRTWEAFFQVASGVSIVTLSVWTNIDKKLTLKAKAQKRQARRITDFVPTPDAVPHGRRVTDFYPKTGQPGRRATDIPWNVPEDPTT